MGLSDRFTKNRRLSLIHWAAVLIVVLLAVFCACFLYQRGDAPLASEGGQVSEPISGWLVFQRPDGIYRQHSKGEGSQFLAPAGRHPRWSHKGREIAFIRGESIMLMRADGSRLRQVGKAQGIRALCFHPSGKAILYVDGNGLYSLTVTSGKVKQLLGGYDFYGLSLSADGTKLVATIKTLFGFQVRFFGLENGESFVLAKGCSATISPDGDYAGVNSVSHKKMSIYRLADRSVVRVLSSPKGTHFDNHYWSNHPDWLVSMVEEQGDIYLHTISGNRAFRLTNTGDSDRADFFAD